MTCINTKQHAATLKTLLLPVALLLTCFQSTVLLHAQGPKIVPSEDRDKSETVRETFYIDESDGKYSLEAEKEVQYNILSERGAEKNTYWIYETYFREHDDVEAELNGRSLDDDNITYRSLESKDLFIIDTKAYSIKFPNVEVGDELRYSYETEYRSADFLPILYINNYNHVNEYELTIEHPEELSVDFNMFMPLGDVPYTVLRDEADKTVLRFGETEETEGLKYYPYDGYHAAVLVQLRDAGGKLINPVELTQFSEWYWNLLDFEVSLSAGEAAELESALKHAVRPAEKARAIYDWVRTNVRYIADESDMNAIVPRPPSTVMERRWGDCKDKGFLCAAIGKQYGVEIHPVLVSTRRRPAFDGIHLSLFNHVINVVEDNGKRIYFDPTYRYGEFGTLPSGDIDADGMILNRANPERVVVGTAFEGVAIDVKIDANLDSLKNGRALIELRDTYQARAEYARTELSGNDLENFLSNMLTGKFRKLSLDYFEYAGKSDSSISFRAHADLSKLIIKSRTKTYLPKVPFGSIDNDILERENDALGLYMRSLEHTRLTLNLTAPGLHASGGDIQFGDEEQQSWMKAELESGPNNSVIARYEYARRSKTFYNAERNAFLDFCRNLLKSKKDMFVFQSKD